MPEKNLLMLYGSLGNTLFWDKVDLSNGTLSRCGSIKMPVKIQYAAMSLKNRMMYVVISDAGNDWNGAKGTVHGIQVLKVNPQNGSLQKEGDLYPLPERPIHCCLNENASALSVSFCQSGSVCICDLTDDGHLRKDKKAVYLKAGHFTHQSIFIDNSHILAVSRGNNPRQGYPEELGSLHQFVRTQSGNWTLEEKRIFPPGVGPRHAFLQKEKNLLYLAIERGSCIETYHLENEKLSLHPLFRTETLMNKKNKTAPRQRGGVLALHPNGKYLYASNRANQPEHKEDGDYLVGGENNLVAYEIDAHSGQPHFLQYVSNHGVEARNLVIDPTGHILIVGNQHTMYIPTSKGWQLNPCNIALFHIEDDGRLTFIRRYIMDGAKNDLIWLGIYRMEVLS